MTLLQAGVLGFVLGAGTAALTVLAALLRLERYNNPEGRASKSLR
jgi:hypothetical protein